MEDSACRAPQFLMTLQTEILSTETSDFHKPIIFIKSFNSLSSVYTLKEIISQPD